MRYLNLLCRVQAPEEIIAITFTRKAAAEMRERVLAALADAANPAPDHPPHLRRRRDLAKAVLAHARTMQWELELNPNRLRIQTIDALSAWLSARMPLLSRIGARPNPVDDAGALYRQAARNTVLELGGGKDWSADVGRLLAHLDNNLPKVEEMLAGLLRRRDQWGRHLREGANRKGLEQALERVVLEALKAVRLAVPATEVGELVDLAGYAAGHLKAVDSASPIVACAGLKALPEATLEALAAWRGIAALLLTNEGEWRKRHDKNSGFPAPSSPGTTSDKAAYTEAKQRIKDLLQRLAEHHHLRQCLHALRELPSPRYSDSEWDTLQALLRMLPLALAHLRLVFQQRGEVDFTEINLAAGNALGPPEAPTDLALALDYRINHLLVDEFQDTSVSQYDTLTRLMAGWQPDDGRTVFLVGDPMQSIYRFREAEVGLFLRAWNLRRIAGVPITPLALSMNFRSRPGIVSWVNNSFARIMPTAGADPDGRVPYSPSQAVECEGAGGSVSIHPLSAADSAAEVRMVVDVVQQAGEARHSVAVLARTRGHLAAIAVGLRQAGIRYQAVEMERLGQRPAIQDLLALTMALLHPADRTAWLAVLRAPWCGLTLADLDVLAGDDHHSTIWQLLCDASRIDGLSTDGQQRVARIRSVLAAALQVRRRGPIGRWLEGTWLSLGGPACLTDDTDLDNATGYFDCLQSLEQGGDILDFALLIRKVQELFAATDVSAPQGVQLMTIHKAKGLEFDVVVVPGLGKSPRADPRHLFMWMERTRSVGETDLLLAPIEQTGEQRQATYSYLRALDAAKDRQEQTRLLYVAATRARLHLHLFGAVKLDLDKDPAEVKAPAAGSLLHRLWPVVEAEFERLLTRDSEVAGSRPPEPQLMADPSLRRLKNAWRLPDPPAGIDWGSIAPVKPPARIEYQWAGATLRHVGTVVHRMLQTVAEQGVSTWDSKRIAAAQPSIRRGLAGLGVVDAEIDAAVARVVTALQRTIADPRGRWVLDHAHEDVHSEYALSGIEGGVVNNIVIDRTFIDNHGIRWIIDYKTGSHLGRDREAFLDNERARYNRQLQRYAEFMCKLESRAIRLGLYFPLLQGWREWSGDEA